MLFYLFVAALAIAAEPVEISCMSKTCDVVQSRLTADSGSYVYRIGAPGKGLTTEPEEVCSQTINWLWRGKACGRFSAYVTPPVPNGTSRSWMYGMVVNQHNPQLYLVAAGVGNGIYVGMINVTSFSCYP